MASLHPLSRREVLLGTFGAAIATVVSGQNRAVRILLSVRDKNGKYVTNLEKADFEVRERGKPQAIQTLAPAESALHLGVLVDMGFGLQSALGQVSEATAAFFLETLRADKDFGSLILFDRDVRLAQAPTQSLADLQKAIETIQPPAPPMGRAPGTGGPGPGGPGAGKGGGQQRPPAGGGGGQPRMSAMGSVVFDAIDFAAEGENATSSERKAIVLLSEGADAGSIETLDGAIEAARKRNLLIYTVRIQPLEGSGGGFQIGMPGGMGGGGMGGGGMGGPGGGGGMGGPGGGMGRGGGGGMGGPGGGMGGPGGGMPQRPDGKKPLQKLAESTGGRYFEFSKKQSLGQILAEIREELHHQYVIEFTPAQQAAAVGFQSIDVRSKRRGTKLQAQPGYYFEL